MREPYLFIVVVFYVSCAGQKNTSKVEDVIFTKTILSNEYISEGVAVADVNRDGRLDVLAGTFWWEAPSGPGMN